VLDLSASLNPFAPDVGALAAAHVGTLRRYPDVEAAEALMADALRITGERLVLTAGGAQAIALVADQLGHGWVEEPEFSLYRRHLARLERGAPRWRSDPHNPTGVLSTTGDRAAVWDEAFLPMSAGVWTRARPGWALGSLTKAFACPGLRVGFAVAPDERAAAAIRRRRPAWAVSSLACAALPDLLAQADPPGWTTRIAAARADLVDVLAAHGLAAMPSDAPWVLVPNAAGMRDALGREAVVVRDCGSFGLVDHVRIAVTDGPGLERLGDALARTGAARRR
jgi:histidinol-phosphate/aromatic aminotransferase/cobyric acid decarboxylase-like protein